MRRAILLPLALVFALHAPSQTLATEHYAAPSPLPADRTADTYAIYSKLLVSGPIEWRKVHRRQWLLQDLSTSNPLELPCNSPYNGDPRTQNPHTDIRIPTERKADWDQVLADYDLHCHEVFALTPGEFKTRLPVRLVTRDQKLTYEQHVLNPPAPLNDAAGLHSFSQVFFNPGHTLALVDQGMYCGGLCGNWTLVVMERRKGKWFIYSKGGDIMS